MFCEKVSCYEISKNRSKICRSYFDNDEPGLTKIENSNHIIIGFIIVWLLLSTDEYFTNVSTGFLRKNGKKREDIIGWVIPRLFAVLLFSIPILFFTIKGSNKESFCLMNRKEPICSNYDQLDCFRNKSNFIGFINIGQGFDSSENLVIILKNIISFDRKSNEVYIFN